MKIGCLALALVLLSACDLRPEDFSRSRDDVQQFNDTWTKILADLSQRRTDLFTRAQKIAAGTAGLDEVLSRLTAVKAKIDDLSTEVGKTNDDATVDLDQRHKKLADDTVTAAAADLQSGVADLRSQLDDATSKLTTLEQQAAAAPKAAAPTPTPAPTPIPMNTPAAAVIEPGFAKGKGIADVPGIEFQMGTAQLDLTKPTTKPALDAIVAFAGACNTLKFDIIGHTAKDGDANVNQRLSLARAGAVRAYLLQAGVSGAEIDKALGVGGTQPATAEPDPGTPEEKAMATDKLAAIRDQNRRISIAVVQPCAG
jgi:OOP family OmpA-OmpF porin